jgi:hypothetical protein
MSKNNDGYTIIPFPKMRRLMVDGGRMGRQKHNIHVDGAPAARFTQRLKELIESGYGLCD